MPCAVLVLAAECQFAVFAKRKEECIHGFRLAGGGEGGLATFALANPDCIDATQTTCADRVDGRHIATAAVADQLFRAGFLDFGLSLGNALCL